MLRLHVLAAFFQAVPHRGRKPDLVAAETFVDARLHVAVNGGQC
jgi:hypothetical protein